MAHGSKTTVGKATAEQLKALLERHASLFAPGAEILLTSCSSGEGGAAADNVINAIADAVPQARVRGATEPTTFSPTEIEDDELVGGIPMTISEYERQPRARKGVAKAFESWTSGR